MGSGSWNAGDRHGARVAACKGNYDPVTYKVKVDDSHQQWKYEMATRALYGWGVGVPSFFIWAAEYVIRHRREFLDVRHVIREREKELRRARRRKLREERAARRTEGRRT